jgi:hypothetical protein
MCLKVVCTVVTTRRLLYTHTERNASERTKHPPGGRLVYKIILAPLFLLNKIYYMHIKIKTLKILVVHIF